MLDDVTANVFVLVDVPMPPVLIYTIAIDVVRTALTSLTSLTLTARNDVTALSPLDVLQGVPLARHRHGSRHRHVVPLPTDQEHEEHAQFTRKVSR